MVALGNGAELSCSQPCGCTVSSEELFFATWNEVKRRLRDPEAIARSEKMLELEQGTLHEAVDYFLAKADDWLSREGKEYLIGKLVREIRVFADRVELRGY
jgi:hypothetical protein